MVCDVMSEGRLMLVMTIIVVLIMLKTKMLDRHDESYGPDDHSIAGADVHASNRGLPEGATWGSELRMFALDSETKGL